MFEKSYEQNVSINMHLLNQLLDDQHTHHQHTHHQHTHHQHTHHQSCLTVMSENATIVKNKCAI